VLARSNISSRSLSSRSLFNLYLFAKSAGVLSGGADVIVRTSSVNIRGIALSLHLRCLRLRIARKQRHAHHSRATASALRTYSRGYSLHHTAASTLLRASPHRYLSACTSAPLASFAWNGAMSGV